MKVYILIMVFNILFSTSLFSQKSKVDTSYFVKGDRPEYIDTNNIRTILDDFCVYRETKGNIIYEYKLYGDNIYKKINEKWWVKINNQWRVFFTKKRFKLHQVSKLSSGFNLKPLNTMYIDGRLIYAFSLFMGNQGTYDEVYFDACLGIVAIQTSTAYFYRLNNPPKIHVRCIR